MRAFASTLTFLRCREKYESYESRPSRFLSSSLCTSNLRGSQKESRLHCRGATWSAVRHRRWLLVGPRSVR